MIITVVCNQDCPTMFTMLHFPSQMCELATLMTNNQQTANSIHSWYSLVTNNQQLIVTNKHVRSLLVVGCWLTNKKHQKPPADQQPTSNQPPAAGSAWLDRTGGFRTWICRSKRPGRTKAWSKMSARLVAAMTTTP